MIDLTPWGADAEVIAPLTGGARNASWKVRVRGRLAAARLSRRGAAALDWEIDLMAAANSAGVRTAELVRTRDDRPHANSIVAFEWLDAVAPASAREWALVRDRLHDLHEATRSWAQRPDFASMTEMLIISQSADVDLNAMPEEVVEECRAAWREITGEPRSAIHGDPYSNVLIVDDEPVFIDWDESRVDASMLDYDLPMVSALSDAQRRAAIACEVARSWTHEPDYARRCLETLRSLN